MKNLLKLKGLLLIGFALFAFSSCSDTTEPVVIPDTTITALAKATPDLSVLVQALVKADLAVTLQGNGPYTVFAPTNMAFTTFLAANGFANLDAVPVPALKQILLNHVIVGRSSAADLTNDKYIKTLANGGATSANALSMYVNKTNGVVLNGVSKVTAADINASNGIIHIVDAVIGLPTIVTHAIANPNFTSLVAALTRTGNTTNFAGILSGTLSSPFTVFAPTNAAFTGALTDLGYANLAAIPEPSLDKILKYHVIAGANVLAAALPSTPTAQNTFLGQTFLIGTTGGAKITDKLNRVANIVATDVQCSNGVIHVLDKVLVPTL